MTNLLIVLPDFDVSPFTHILPSLEKTGITTPDLLTLDAQHVAKRAQIPSGEVQKLIDALIPALHGTASAATCRSVPNRGDADVWNRLENASLQPASRAAISVLDDHLNAALGGGIALGHLTEIVGESAAGKTQFLLTLLLSAQLFRGAELSASVLEPKSVLYISTEAPLQTTRLSQILGTHPEFTALESNHRPSLSRIHSTHIHDVEAQEHILRFQVPVAIKVHNVGLVVIDSIAANYRAEFDKGSHARKSAEVLAQRNAQLVQLGSLLRNIARAYNIAVVVANQVADRFAPNEPALQVPSQSTQGTRLGSPLPPSLPQTMPAELSTSILSTDDPLAVDHQQRFFTGWGDDPSAINLKTPSLGLTWTNQLATRIALLKTPIYEQKVYAPGEDRNVTGWNRACKVVFSATAAESTTSFEIWKGGVRARAEQEAIQNHGRT